MAGDTYCEGDAQHSRCNGQRVVDCGFQGLCNWYVLPLR